jgi:uncharacterized protein
MTMETETRTAVDRLEAALEAIGPLGVAVSGGVDSMTLAVVAHRRAPAAVEVYHAVSPAVPTEATERVRARGRREGWALTVVDAGELADPAYRANPHDRCFHCKTNLYRAIRQRTARTIASGANVDDLGDYRPGLKAADEHGVRHPLVEAGIGKRRVRALAAALGLDDVAELPAAPCLASRIETGIAIEADMLGAVDAAESFIRRRLRPGTVRCRLRRSGVVVELDEETLARVGVHDRAALAGPVATMFAGSPVAFEPYRMGSAFLRRAGQ